ncbi:MAG: esterase/lipase family protein [Acidimicrobiales bacterium]
MAPRMVYWTGNHTPRRLGVTMRSAVVRAIVVALVVSGVVGLAGPGANATPITPTATSSGFNDWSCQPGPAHPNPVVLLHGLGGNGPGNWSYVGPQLAAGGFCAFALTYGQASPFIPVGGTIAVAESARQIAAFIDDVRAATGAAEVDIVGHSEGGFQSLYVPKMLDYGDEVGRVVALAPPTHGTTVSGLVTIGDALGLRPLYELVLRLFGCQACTELIVGGAPVTELTTGPIAEPGVEYTILASRYDVVVTPPESSFIDEPGVANVFVQDVCPLDPVGHVGLAFDSGVAQMIVNGLDPEHAAPVSCGFGPPF